ncbi:MAG: NAD(P)H-quinone oxidoreductase [Myxococcota bacterium]
MKGVVVREPGGPDVLAVQTLPDPAPAEGEILIRNRATALNRADVLQRMGFYPPPPGASEVPGLECAGEVKALGPGVSGIRTGERVFALLAGGGYAEKVVVPADVAMRIPAGLDFEQAAAVPEVFTTAYDNLVNYGRVQKDEWALVHGGGSGVGTACIQLLRRLGARCAVTVGSKEKAERCLALGADAAINYREEEFDEATRAASGGRGVDVILDIIGGAYLERNLKSLAPDGRLVIIGAIGGIQGEINLGLMLGKRLSIQATTLRARPVAYKARLARQLEAEVLPGLADGSLVPVVDRVFDLSKVAEAHRLMESNAHFGKIVLRI